MIVPEINEITDFLKKANKSQSVQTKTTGFPSIDKLGQYSLGGLTVIAGYPGMGVTVFMISSLINLTKLNVSCTYVSLKEPALSTIRLIAANLFQSEDFKSSKCSDIDFIKSIDGSTLDALPIQICDNSNIYVNDLDFILGIRKQVGLEISKVFFIDDLDELKVGEGENNKDKLSLICKELKELAARYQISIVVGHTVRPFEGSIERPTLSMLRKDGEIEQTASMIIFLYRHEYFKIEISENGTPTQGLIELTIAKSKHGKTGSAEMKFIGKYYKVEDA